MRAAEGVSESVALSRDLRGPARRSSCKGREVSRREPLHRGPKTPASLEHGQCGGEMGQPGRACRDLAPRATGSHGRQEQRQIHCLLFSPHSQPQAVGWDHVATSSQWEVRRTLSRLTHLRCRAQTRRTSPARQAPFHRELPWRDPGSTACSVSAKRKHSVQPLRL